MELQPMTVENIYYDNPVQPGNVLEEYGRGREKFYLINFWNIKNNSYIISIYGRIFSLFKMKQMIPYESYGYYRISLKMNDNRTRKFFIHRLVAFDFIPKSVEDIEYGRDFVNHINTIKKDNHIFNLEWVTTKENCRHSVDNDIHNRIKVFSYTDEELFNKRDFRNKASSILTYEQVITICENLAIGKSYKECCEAIGLEYNSNNRAIIGHIFRKETWKDVVNNYDFPEPTRFYKKDYVDDVCKLLEQGLCDKEIIELIELPGTKAAKYCFLYSLRNRLAFKDICSKYNY